MTRPYPNQPQQPKAPKDSLWHNRRGDKYQHLANGLKDRAARRIENSKQEGLGFFKKHSMLRQSAKDTKQANKLASKALYHWNKADKWDGKHHPVSAPQEPNPFHTHLKSPATGEKGHNWDDWTHTDYHDKGSEEFGAEDKPYSAKPNHLPKAETPLNTHEGNPTPKPSSPIHPPHQYGPKPYENHIHFEHQNSEGGNRPQTDFESKEERGAKRADENAHTPHYRSGKVSFIN